MALKMPAVSGGGNYDPAPEGNHVAVCFAAIDFGTQPPTFPGATEHKRIVYIGWELPDEKTSDGRPFTIGKQYTYSSHPKSTLRRDLEAWRGKKFSDSEIEDFDIAKLIGAGCMIGIVHTEKQVGQYLNTYANISTVAKLPRGVTAPKLVNKPVEFSLDDPDWDVFDGLRDWMKEKIQQAPEYREAAGFPAKQEVSTAAKANVSEFPVRGSAPLITTDLDLNDDVPF